MRTKFAIFLILGFGLLVRLYSISSSLTQRQNFLEIREASQARYFYKESLSFFSTPEIETSSTKKYITLPIIPYLSALLYHIFGQKEIIGRILCIIFSLLATIILFKLVRRVFNKETAVISALLFNCFPISIYFGRIFYRQMMSLFFALTFLYFFIQWKDKNKIKYLILSILFGCLATLSHQPYLYLLIPIAYLAIFSRREKIYKRWDLILLVFILIAFIFVSTPQLFFKSSEIFKARADMIKLRASELKNTGIIGRWLDPAGYGKFYDCLVNLAYMKIGGILLLIGIPALFFSIKNFNYPLRKIIFIFLWIAGLMAYVVLDSYGFISVVHEYHYLQFIPLGAIFCAIAIYWISLILKRLFIFSKSLIVSLSIIIAFLTFLSGTHNLREWFISNEPIFRAGKYVDQIVEPDAKVVEFEGDRPLLYYCNRKGFHLTQNQTTEDLNQYIKEGANYFVTLRPDLPLTKYVYKNYPLISSDKDFLVFKLISKKDYYSSLQNSEKLSQSLLRSKINFDNKIELLGYILDKSVINPEEKIQATLHFRVISKNISKVLNNRTGAWGHYYPDFQVMLRSEVSSAYNTMLLSEIHRSYELFPMREWDSGTTETVKFDFIIPQWFPPGNYSLTLRIWNGYEILKPINQDIKFNNETEDTVIGKVIILSKESILKVKKIKNGIDISNEISISDISLNRKIVLSGEDLSINLTWQTLKSINKDYSINLWLGNDTLKIHLCNHKPLFGLYPTSKWNYGEEISDTINTIIPYEVKPGNYNLFASIESNQDDIEVSQKNIKIGDIQILPAQYKICDPVIRNPLNLNFMDRIILKGYEFDKIRARKGEPFKIIFQWQMISPERFIQVFEPTLRPAKNNTQSFIDRDKWFYFFHLDLTGFTSRGLLPILKVGQAIDYIEGYRFANPESSTNDYFAEIVFGVPAYTLVGKSKTSFQLGADYPLIKIGTVIRINPSPPYRLERYEPFNSRENFFNTKSPISSQAGAIFFEQDGIGKPADITNICLKRVDESTTSTNNIYTFRREPVKEGYVNFWYKPISFKGITPLTFFIYYNKFFGSMILICRNENNFLYFDGTYNIIQPYENNHWYHFHIKFNCPKSKYSIYINNVCRMRNAKFITPQEYVDIIMFGGGAPESTGIDYIDEVTWGGY